MENLKFSRKIRIGLIGASPDTWIGSIHHNSFLMDNLYELVSGSFSRDSKKSQDIGSKLHLNPKRVYESWEEFLEKEATMEKDVKIDVVVIVTPNNLHYAPSKKALSLGFHVILDKPLCINLEEAYDLEFTIKKNDLLFCLTHCYTGYPMIKEAKSLIKNGKIGKLRKVIVDYPQGWLTTRLELFNYNAKNRQQPDIAGKSCTLSDVGTHAENLLEYVTGLKIKEVCAHVTTAFEDRLLDDDSSVLLKLEGGVKGVLLASQVLTGEENSISVKVWGETGGIEWCQNDCNTLKVKLNEQPVQLYRTGTNISYLSKEALSHSRSPGGHPDGYIEAFANLYRNFAYRFYERLDGKKVDNEIYDYPGIEDGIRGMLFVEKVLENNKSDKKWTCY